VGPRRQPGGSCWQQPTRVAGAKMPLSSCASWFLLPSPALKGTFPMNLRLPEICRRFSLSPSEGERAGVRGPSWGSGVQSASACRGILSPSDGERDGVRGPTSIPRPFPVQACGSGLLSLSGCELALQHPGPAPRPGGRLRDIAGLYLDKFSLLPTGRRISIQTVQQINGWRNLPPPPFSARISTIASTNTPVSRPGRAIFHSTPPVFPLYTPSKPLVITSYYNRR
jgi:hypothetical protein